MQMSLPNLSLNAEECKEASRNITTLDTRLLFELLVFEHTSFLCVTVVHHGPVIVLARSVDHARSDTSNSNIAMAVLDLIEEVIILAMCDRVFSARGLLHRLDGTRVTGLRHHRRAVATTRFAFRRMMRSGFIRVIMLRLVRAMGAVRVLARFRRVAGLAHNRAVGVFLALVAAVLTGRSDLRNAVAWHDSVHVIVRCFFNLQVIDEIVVVFTGMRLCVPS